MKSRHLLLAIASFLGIGAVGLLTYAELHHWQLQHSTDEARFIKGINPQPSPAGLYAGLVPGLQKPSWQGKRFDAQTASGVNIFIDNGRQTMKFPFRTSSGAGSLNPNLRVLRIDYNNPHNPWWLRLFLDEVVAIEPGQLLGKLSIRLIPGHPYAILFFELRQSNIHKVASTHQLKS